MDINKLKGAIEDSGMTMIFIASRSGITRATLYNKLAGQGEFTVSEAERLSDTLHLTAAQRDKIFFAHEVELNAT